MMGNIRDEAYALASERVDRQGTFRSAYLDFERGIRVGHLAVDARLTQIIKSRLTARYGVRMLCDRWGRGLYWQWLCWVPEPNKKAKPLSAGHILAPRNSMSRLIAPSVSSTLACKSNGPRSTRMPTGP